ncbi:hypothetical protein U27_03673 [Candidatus Vecturithrix granuli]|uniref:Uncharacterized protein n=1 Tax=Vecturithrix granuli TaxID=1499967 RepID=A0A081BWK5_VECG1|nr:hypothetical protein U27_03673 [Candidatus Vecturithrix granuli]
MSRFGSRHPVVAPELIDLKQYALSQSLSS